MINQINGNYHKDVSYGSSLIKINKSDNYIKKYIIYGKN
jgi:hypothetical protein